MNNTGDINGTKLTGLGPNNLSLINRIPNDNLLLGNVSNIITSRSKLINNLRKSKKIIAKEIENKTNKDNLP